MPSYPGLVPSRQRQVSLSLVIAAALAACSPASPVQHAAPGTSRPSSAAAHGVRVRGVSPAVTLAFAGDVHFTGRTAALLDNPATTFGPVSSVLRSADLTMVNLETAVTNGGMLQPKASYVG